MLGSFFWGIACIICCFVGAYLYCEHDSKVWSTLSMILAIILMLITIFSASFNTTKNMQKAYDGIIAEKDKQIEYLTSKSVYKSDITDINECVHTISGCYEHKAAEIVSCEQLDNGSYEVVFSVEQNQTQAYIWISDEPMEDVPYLLTMNENDMADYTDDEIMVCWACVE